MKNLDMSPLIKYILLQSSGRRRDSWLFYCTCCRVAAITLCLFHLLPWMGLLSVSVAFAYHPQKLMVGLW